MGINGKKVLALIPARAGSKGLPGKNYKLLKGKPLIQWTLDAALGSEYIDKIVVSSNSPEIKAIVESSSAHFLERPENLSTDISTSSEVIMHVLGIFPDFDILIYLQPTSPYRTTLDIDNSFRMYISNCLGNHSALVGICQNPIPLELIYLINDEQLLKPVLPTNNFTNRQDFNITYYLNGSIFISSINDLCSTNGSFHSLNMRGFLMSQKSSIDIDTIEDFIFAENI